MARWFREQRGRQTWWAGGGSLFGGARAEGGPTSAGRAYLVGERGPELFVPRTSGAVLPNGAGGANVKVEVIDMRRAGGPPIEESRTTGPNGETIVRAIVRDEIDRANRPKGRTGRELDARGLGRQTAKRV